MSAMKYPEKLYVKAELLDDGDYEQLAYEDTIYVAEPGEEVEVAVYKFVRIAKVTAKVKVS